MSRLLEMKETIARMVAVRFIHSRRNCLYERSMLYCICRNDSSLLFTLNTKILCVY